jgi:23S rRNA (cytosine1962-C5)-methyltransferase
MQDFKINLPNTPSQSKKRIAIRITKAAERALVKGHPWLFESAIIKQSQDGQPGDLAVIFDRRQKFLAIGLYDPTSIIRVRILQHHNPATINQDWFTTKITSASKIREKLPEKTNAYRLINGENDHLPGLIIDRYAQAFVIKIYSIAWMPYIGMLATILVDRFSPQHIVLRLGRNIQSSIHSSDPVHDGQLIYGKPLDRPILILENGITFEVDLIHGHKTGFYLDQRDNRSRVEKISKNKNVLNVFAYTGGFSVYAARGGACQVTSLDLNRLALLAAQRNFTHNQDHPAIKKCIHKTRAGDAFKLLTEMVQAKRSFDIVIIDPPSFAKKSSEVDKAIAAYQRLTQLGINLLEKNGILVQASCSSRISRTAFFEAVLQASRNAGRPLNEIERTGHPIDHPIHFPEGEYLKCLFAKL